MTKVKTPTTAAFGSQKGGVGEKRACAVLGGRRDLSRPQDLARRLRSRPADLRRMERATPAREPRAGDRHARLQEPEETAPGDGVAAISSSPTRADSPTISRANSPRTATWSSCRPASRATTSGRRLRWPADWRSAAPRRDSCSSVEGRPFGDAIFERRRDDRGGGFELLANIGRSATASRAISTSAAPVARRAIPICAKSPGGWRKRFRARDESEAADVKPPRRLCFSIVLWVNFPRRATPSGSNQTLGARQAMSQIGRKARLGESPWEGPESAE